MDRGACALLVLLAISAAAQQFPTRPIRLIVGPGDIARFSKVIKEAGIRPE
jgi:hypothetical protein